MNLVLWNRLRRIGNTVSLIGVVQFFILTGVAMQHYPGGTPRDSRVARYSFFENPLSDLGRDRSWSGADNSASARLFNSSLMLLALASVPFFLFLPTHAPDRSAVLLVAAAFGVLSTIGLIGIALTPYDVQPREHLTALFFWLAALFVAVTLHFVALFFSRERTVVFSFVSLGYAMLIALYIGRGVDLGMASVRRIEAPLEEAVIVQKWVAIVSIVWYLVFSLRMMFVRQVIRTPHRSEVDAGAQQYLRQVEQGFRR